MEPFGLQFEAIENSRCEADILYAVLFNPEFPLILAGPTPEDPPVQVKLIDRLLGETVRLLSKKYAPEYETALIIKQARAFLESPSADDTIKQFYFLFALSKETALQTMIRNSLDPNHPGNLWGKRCLSHLDDFLRELDRMVMATKEWHYNELNAKHIVRNMVNAAARAYLVM